MSALLLLVKDLRLQTVAPEKALALDTDWCPSSMQEFPPSPSLVPAAVLASEQTRELPSEFPVGCGMTGIKVRLKKRLQQAK